jgi:hypothetical protein
MAKSHNSGEALNYWRGETSAMDKSSKLEQRQMPIDFWDELSPEGVVSGIHTELYQHVIAIEGYSSFLLLADLTPEERLRATESLLAHAEYTKSVFEALHHYSVNRRLYAKGASKVTGEQQENEV